MIGRQGAEVNRLRAEIDQHLRSADEFWPRLDIAENARNLLAAQLADLQRQFATLEADHAARGQVIEDQGANITHLHAEADKFWPRLDIAENARNLLAAQLADLQRQFATLEADHAARGQVIEDQGAKLDAAVNARNLLAAQMDDLHTHFERSEADRAARLRIIEELQATAADLWPRLETAQHEINLRTAQLADLRGHFDNSEADRAARLEVIESQGVVVARLQSQLATNESERARLSATLDSLQSQLATNESERTRLSAEVSEIHTAHATLTGEFEAARARHRTLEKHWTTRVLKKIGLWPL